MNRFCIALYVLVPMLLVSPLLHGEDDRHSAAKAAADDVEDCWYAYHNPWFGAPTCKVTCSDGSVTHYKVSTAAACKRECQDKGVALYGGVSADYCQTKGGGAVGEEVEGATESGPVLLQ